jgi:plastocyanin
MKRLVLTPLLLLFIEAAAGAAEPEVKLVIQDHRFQPAELTVPAGKKIRLAIENRDATAEEFESKALDREKVIAGKSSTTLFVGPLAPGRYPFVGEYHEATAKGVVVAE